MTQIIFDVYSLDAVGKFGRLEAKIPSTSAASAVDTVLDRLGVEPTERLRRRFVAVVTSAGQGRAHVCYTCDAPSTGVADRHHFVEGGFVPACDRHREGDPLGLDTPCDVFIGGICTRHPNGCSEHRLRTYARMCEDVAIFRGVIEPDERGFHRDLRSELQYALADDWTPDQFVEGFVR